MVRLSVGFAANFLGLAGLRAAGVPAGEGDLVLPASERAGEAANMSVE